jgi:hypothetical protein
VQGGRVVVVGDSADLAPLGGFRVEAIGVAQLAGHDHDRLVADRRVVRSQIAPSGSATHSECVQRGVRLLETATTTATAVPMSTPKISRSLISIA